MVNLRDLVNENSSLDDLVVLRGSSFDYDIVDHVVLSRLEARNKWRMGETDTWEVDDTNPDTICITSHYSPGSTRVLFAMMYREITSNMDLTEDMADIFYRLEDAHFQYQSSYGKYTRDNPSGRHENPRYEEEVEQSQQRCLELLQYMRGQYPDLFEQFTKSTQSTGEKIRQVHDGLSALLGFTKNPNLYDGRIELSPEDENYAEELKRLFRVEPCLSRELCDKIPNPNYTKDGLSRLREELITSVGIEDTSVLQEIIKAAETIHNHGIVEQVVTVLDNDLYSVSKTDIPK